MTRSALDVVILSGLAFPLSKPISRRGVRTRRIWLDQVQGRSGERTSLLEAREEEGWDPLDLRVLVVLSWCLRAMSG